MTHCDMRPLAQAAAGPASPSPRTPVHPNKGAAAARGNPAPAGSVPVLHMADVTQVLPCCDPSLPQGHAFWVGLRSSAQGCYFVAETEQDAAVWIDVITMVAHILTQGSPTNLEYVLAENLRD